MGYLTQMQLARWQRFLKAPGKTPSHVWFAGVVRAALLAHLDDRVPNFYRFF